MAERRAEMWRMRLIGYTQREIAAHYGITQQSVSQNLRRAYLERPAQSVDEYRAMELDKYDEAERAVRDVLNRRHVTISGGGVVMAWDEDAQAVMPILDDAPVLAAVDRLLKISKCRTDLLGMQAPTKISVEAATLGQEIADLLTKLSDDQDDD